LRLKTTGHWTATVLVAFPLRSAGAAQSVGQKKTVETIMRVGYPAYLLTGRRFSCCEERARGGNNLLAALAVIPWALRLPSRALEILFSVRTFSS